MSVDRQKLKQRIQLGSKGIGRMGKGFHKEGSMGTHKMDADKSLKKKKTSGKIGGGKK